MALGSANNSAQARGKNKAVKIKRRREVRSAINYRSIGCGRKAANHPASCSGTPVGEVFYHNGSSAIPAVNDVVYTSKRARNPNSFEAGFYKVDGGGGRFKTLEINSAGVVVATQNC
tara:strand:- start:3157 stop:3507 length:351 start_codon:yes stop_codon:yes gene_type:complete